MTDDDLRAESTGEVRNFETYSQDSGLPLAQGMFCEAIFGPVPWKAGEHRATEDARNLQWGHIEVGEPICLFDVETRVVLVVPPAYRRHRALSAAEHRDLARRERAELIAEHGSSAAAERILAEAGRDDPEAIENLGAATLPSPLTVAYCRLFSRARRLARVRQLGLPDVLIANARNGVRGAAAALGAELRRSIVDEEVLRRALGRS